MQLISHTHRRSHGRTVKYRSYCTCLDGTQAYTASFLENIFGVEQICGLWVGLAWLEGRANLPPECAHNKSHCINSYFLYITAVIIVNFLYHTKLRLPLDINSRILVSLKRVKNHI